MTYEPGTNTSAFADIKDDTYEFPDLGSVAFPSEFVRQGNIVIPPESPQQNALQINFQLSLAQPGISGNLPPFSITTPIGDRDVDANTPVFTMQMVASIPHVFTKGFKKQLVGLIAKLKILEAQGDKWDEEYSTPGPNNFAIQSTTRLLTELSVSNLFPYRITQSVEAGICIQFKGGDQIFYAEIYNDGDIGYIIEDTKRKSELGNESLGSIDALRKAIVKFYS